VVRKCNWVKSLCAPLLQEVVQTLCIPWRHTNSAWLL